MSDLSLDYAASFTVSCASCGTQYSAEMKFCARCGAALHRTDAIKAAPPVFTEKLSPPANYRAPSVGKKKRAWMVPVFAGAAMVLFLMVVTPVWFVMNNARDGGSVSTNSQTPVGIDTNSNTSANINTDFQVTSDTEFVGVDGRTYRLSEFQGRVVLLNFWSTSSVSSKAQVAVLNDLQNRYGSRGLVVIGLSKDTTEQVKQFLKDSPHNYLVGLRTDEIESQLPAPSLPTAYLIDRLGRVRKRLIGPQSRQAFENSIQPLLRD